MNSTDKDDCPPKRLTAVFRTREYAEQAYHAIEALGYERKDINIIMTDHTREQFRNDMLQAEIGNKAVEGVAIGGAIGVVVGILSALGTALFFPGLGLIVAGPLAAALAGAGVGGSTGGLIGALIGWGISEEHAKKYEEDLRKGGVILSICPRNEEDAKYIEKIWRSNNGKITYQ